MSISQGFGDVRSRARQGRVGALVYAARDVAQAGAGFNKEGQATQVGTIVVDTSTADTVYTWTINGVTMTYTSDSSTSTTEIAAGIADVINAEPLVRGQVSASASSATVTLTATNVGIAFTASDSDSRLTTTEASTAAASASTIPFGRAVIDTGRNTGEGEPCLGIASTGTFAAQVLTLSSTYVASAELNVTVWEIRNGEQPRVLASSNFTSATDLDTTLDGLVAALNTALPANSVLAAADDATATAIVLTAEIDGLEFDAEIRHVRGGASVPVFGKAFTTGPSISTSLNRAFLGVSAYSPSYEATSYASTAEAEYPANSMVTYRKAGCGDSVWVQSTQSPTNADTVYVELAPGSTAGRFYNDASATRVALSRNFAQWERDGYVANDSLAALRLGS